MYDELKELVEELAEAAHDEWMKERLRQGWVYGEKRDDATKQHPCLVPYQQLSEEEKELDRVMVRGNIRAIINAGWKISR